MEISTNEALAIVLGWDPIYEMEVKGHGMRNRERDQLICNQVGCNVEICRENTSIDRSIKQRENERKNSILATGTKSRHVNDCSNKGIMEEKGRLIIFFTNNWNWLFYSFDLRI